MLRCQIGEKKKSQVEHLLARLWGNRHFRMQLVEVQIGSTRRIPKLEMYTLCYSNSVSGALSYRVCVLV